ncbi:hypothetical protein AJ78_01924 [Emergomyces pasteurianus Ep9510]|uniref:Uncharacterized protein n=1 Tax=Emergomyces pasteurianus Ep9510 TaxID=1447872 RepID=A0A1J9PNH2_9EURO|nr:hypothetical protein AJ78_01924 [Emergomyces pasteurianus Ep9510]
MDFNSPIPLDFIRGKTILLTGGASGFGAAFFSRWASKGATVVIGDINTTAGTELVARVREETRNPNLHFLPLDVTSWQSQVEFFREAVKLSPHGGIDTVVANAGICNPREARYFEQPSLDYQTHPNPPAPKLTTVDVNLTGTLYTTHLALFYLPRNPESTPCSPLSQVSTSPPENLARDRHILLLGSVAGVAPLPTQTPYCISKHGVTGLFRALRTTAPLNSGVRVNMLCPYFTETPILSVGSKVVLSGVALSDINHVADAATRFVADSRCVGRSVVIAPKLRVWSPLSGPEGEEERIPGMGGARGIPDKQDIYALAPKPTNGGLQLGADIRGEGRKVREIAIWEVYAHDLEDADLFTRRIMNILMLTAKLRGWWLFAGDLWRGFGMVLKKIFVGSDRKRKRT